MHGQQGVILTKVHSCAEVSLWSMFVLLVRASLSDISRFSHQLILIRWLYWKVCLAATTGHPSRAHLFPAFVAFWTCRSRSDQILKADSTNKQPTAVRVPGFYAFTRTHYPLMCSVSSLHCPRQSEPWCPAKACYVLALHKQTCPVLDTISSCRPLYHPPMFLPPPSCRSLMHY